MTIRVLLADDQPVVRAGLRMLINDIPDIEIVGEAGTGAAAVQLATDLHPDVVVMDIRMPVMDGIEATRLIKAGTSASVVVLTTFDDDENVYASLHAGASGFLIKDMMLDDIVAAVRVVAAGDALIAPGVTRRLIQEFTGRGAVPARRRREIKGITGREREVLALIGRGMSNAEIAAHLYISMATTKSHVARLLTKLDARDRVQLVIAAYESGMV
ncbi:DNA-binding NarL/FixJ family response regulator [Streptomyces puniciscabiei]|uniref:DNA-binding NarL/FixJ family response regulator n=1 Tax=Streptomyces puniciscabiei TaxID=164348 RepID=A0A542UBZ2_9ACTN|nr:response regulator transcription factor [Streptomyces puniciscabiei]TQK96602.1 DNA-binding NarL/FixJ family response regulator [Streptomyces puniciscabiei]